MRVVVTLICALAIIVNSIGKYLGERRALPSLLLKARKLLRPFWLTRTRAIVEKKKLK